MKKRQISLDSLSEKLEKILSSREESKDAWSPEARRAAIEARRRKMKGKQESEGTSSASGIVSRLVN